MELIYLVWQNYEDVIKAFRDRKKAYEFLDKQCNDSRHKNGHEFDKYTNGCFVSPVEVD